MNCCKLRMPDLLAANLTPFCSTHLDYIPPGIDTHARTHTCTHTHMHAHKHARTHTCTHTRTHAHTHARTHAHNLCQQTWRTDVIVRTIYLVVIHESFQYTTQALLCPSNRVRLQSSCVHPVPQRMTITVISIVALVCTSRAEYGNTVRYIRLHYQVLHHLWTYKHHIYSAAAHEPYNWHN